MVLRTAPSFALRKDCFAATLVNNRGRGVGLHKGLGRDGGSILTNLDGKGMDG